MCKSPLLFLYETVTIHLRKTKIHIIIYLLILTSCSSSKELSNRISKNFRIEYPAGLTYTKKIENNRAKILTDFFKNFEIDSKPFYIIENVYFRGGDFQTKHIKTYFWQNDTLIEVYYIDGYEKKLERRKNQYWGVEHTIPTLKTIVTKTKNAEFKGLKEMHKNEKYQLSHSGAYYVSEILNKKEINHIQKFVEFMIPTDNDFSDFNKK
jgi:hypothetical protein